MLSNLYLRKISVYSWILKLIPIPIGIITARLISEVILSATDGKVNEVVKSGFILFIIIFTVKIFEIITNTEFQKASSRAVQRCKMEFYKVFISNPLYALFLSNQGDAVEKLNDDFNTITDKDISLYPTFWTGFITVIIYSAFLAYNNLLISAVLLLISLLQIIPPIIVKKHMQTSYEKCREIEAKITDFTVENCRGFMEIKLYDLKRRRLDKLKEYHEQYIKVGNASIYAAQAEIVMYKLLNNILRYGSYGIIGLLVLKNYSTIDIGIQAIALSGSLFQAVHSVFSQISQFAVVKSAEKRISNWFADENPPVAEICSSDIQFFNVSLCYSEKGFLLRNIDVTFNGNKINVIRGGNGIGKSSMLRLMVGLISCFEGEIKTGGVNTANISANNFPNKIFYLPQEDPMFDFTAEELYSMVCPEKLRRVSDIAQQFNLTKEILTNVKISELSGGQRKKVFLSLAFALEPCILLLDEPTNSLDKKSRVTLKNLLTERRGGAVIITHDKVFDDISDCDYRISDGGILIEKSD